MKLYVPPGAETTPGNPDYNGEWDLEAGAFYRGLLKDFQRALSLATLIATITGVSDRDIIFGQFLSDELTPGQTITGGQTIRFQCRAKQAQTTNDSCVAFGLWVIAGDFATIRKVLVPVTRDDVELDAGGLVNRSLTVISEAGNYTTNADGHDRLLLEVGLAQPVVI
jgi:hypothetical protein